jgi:quinoprotein glucose dehydrogenase
MTRAATPRARALTTKMTDREADAVFMPTGQTGSPMTYMLNGKQYIVIAVSGGSYSGEYLAFSLPSE